MPHSVEMVAAITLFPSSSLLHASCERYLSMIGDSFKYWGHYRKMPAVLMVDRKK